MKKLLKILVALLAIAILLIVGIYVLADRKFAAATKATYTVAVPFESAADGDVVLGERIARIRNGCVDCHGQDLAGGIVTEDLAAGNVYGPNLTPFSLATWTDGEIARAIRNGVHKSGRGLFIMPSLEYNHLSEHDLKSVVVYLRTLPTTERPNRDSVVGPVIKTLYWAGELPDIFAAASIDHSATFTSKPEEAPTVEFGRYLITASCTGCHGVTLAGGPIPGGPPDWAPASDLRRTALKDWDQAAFIKTMRTGVNPKGHALRPPMPVKVTALLSDLELEAMWLYLESLETSI